MSKHDDQLPEESTTAQSSDDELTPLAQQIIRIWAKFRPNATAAMKRHGTLEETARITAKAVADEHQSLWEAGIPGPEALNQAMAELVYRPDKGKPEPEDLEDDEA